jgi:hypothetical protein
MQTALARTDAQTGDDRSKVRMEFFDGHFSRRAKGRA